MKHTTKLQIKAALCCRVEESEEWSGPAAGAHSLHVSVSSGSLARVTECVCQSFCCVHVWTCWDECIACSLGGLVWTCSDEVSRAVRIDAAMQLQNIHCVECRDLNLSLKAFLVEHGVSDRLWSCGEDTGERSEYWCNPQSCSRSTWAEVERRAPRRCELFNSP